MDNALTARRALRIWLAEHDKTQAWLAKRLRVDQSLVSRVFAGYKKPSPKVVDAIKRVTGIDLTQFEKVA